MSDLKQKQNETQLIIFEQREQKIHMFVKYSQNFKMSWSSTGHDFEEDDV